MFQKENQSRSIIGNGRVRIAADFARSVDNEIDQLILKAQRLYLTLSWHTGRRRNAINFEMQTYTLGVTRFSLSSFAPSPSTSLSLSLSISLWYSQTFFFSYFSRAFDLRSFLLRFPPMCWHFPAHFNRAPQFFVSRSTLKNRLPLLRWICEPTCRTKIVRK